jgi:hypothetical protein
MFLLVLKLLEIESSKYTSDRRHKKTGEKSFLHSSPAAATCFVLYGLLQITQLLNNEINCSILCFKSFR